MDLSTKYLGLNLPHPLILGASPLSDDVDTVKKVAEAGAAAIVMHSLFEEQILMEQAGADANISAHQNSFAEAVDYFPKSEQFAFGPEEYLKQIAKLKAAVGIPVIGSLNGTT